MDLEKINIFKGLSTVDQARLLGKMELIEFQPSSVIFQQGELGHTMYIIISGKIELSTVKSAGEKQTLVILEEGDILGEMALLTQAPRSASAIARTDTRLFCITQSVFNEVLAENTCVSLYFIRLLTDRLTKTNYSLQENRKVKKNIVAEEVRKLPDNLQHLILSASLLPSPISQAFWSLEEIKDLSNRCSLVNYLLEKKDNELYINPSIKSVLADMFESSYQESEKKDFIKKASSIYLENKDYVPAMQVLTDNNYWEDGLSLANQTMIQWENQLEVSSQIFKNLVNCPNKLLFSHYSIFIVLLKTLLNQESQLAWPKLLAALEGTESFFSDEQLIHLYQLSSEYYEKEGNHQKALEYINMSLHYAESFKTVSKSLQEVCASNQERSYQLTKQNLEKASGLALVNQARRLFKKNTLVNLLTTFLAVFILLYFSTTPPFVGLSKDGMIFLGITLASVAFWIVNIVPTYIVALLMTMAWVVSGIVKPELALSGFATPIWLFMIFIMGLGAAISKSGLMFRFSLLILKAFPKHYRGQLLGLAVGGLVFNPLIPSAITKVALAGPLSRSMAESMNFPNRSSGSAGLSLMAMIFYGNLCSFFLTGSYTNMMLLGLQKGYSISWLEWFYYSLPALIFFMVGMFFLTYYRFRPEKETTTLSQEILNQQLKMLGKLTKEEKLTILVTVSTILLMIFQYYHHIDNCWTMLVGFTILVLGQVLDENTLKNDIDWMFLLFLGVIFSFAYVAEQLGVVKWVAEFFAHYLKPFMGSPYLFLPAIVITVLLTTFIVQDDPAAILLTLALTPLGQQVGIHPWVLMFVILTASTPFFFPYQSPLYLLTYYSTGEKSFSHQQGQFVAICYALVVLITVILCIPYWQLIGLIRS